MGRLGDYACADFGMVGCDFADVGGWDHQTIPYDTMGRNGRPLGPPILEYFNGGLMSVFSTPLDKMTCMVVCSRLCARLAYIIRQPPTTSYKRIGLTFARHETAYHHWFDLFQRFLSSF